MRRRACQSRSCRIIHGGNDHEEDFVKRVFFVTCRSEGFDDLKGLEINGKVTGMIKFVRNYGYLLRMRHRIWGASFEFMKTTRPVVVSDSNE